MAIVTCACHGLLRKALVEKGKNLRSFTLFRMTAYFWAPSAERPALVEPVPAELQRPLEQYEELTGGRW